MKLLRRRQAVQPVVRMPGHPVAGYRREQDQDIRIVFQVRCVFVRTWIEFQSLDEALEDYPRGGPDRAGEYTRAGQQRSAR